MRTRATSTSRTVTRSVLGLGMQGDLPTAGVAARYLDVKTTAGYLSLSSKAVYHRVARREIPFIKKGRRVLFDRMALDRWMRRTAVDAATGDVIDSPRPTEPRQRRG